MAWYTKPEPVDLSTFEETGDYNSRDLEAYADAILRLDIKANGNVEHILFKEHLDSRKRREFLVPEADPTITAQADDKDRDGIPKRPGVHRGDGQKMYNRTHPRGRKQNTDKQRTEHGASFYRG